MLTLENVSLNYGSFTALNGVSLHADQGELVVLLGANGAGKSSIFLTISGIHRAAGGSIRYGDKNLVGMKPSQIVANGVVQCPEGRKLFPGMSVLKNLMLGAYVHRGDSAGNRQRLDEVLALFPILDQKKDDPAGSLSGGQQQMVAIGRALMGRPKVLLLDEPSMGLSPIMVDKIFEVVRDVSQQGVTIVLVEQNARRALQIADRGYVMDSGEIIMTGNGRDMLDDPKVRAAYLGE